MATATATKGVSRGRRMNISICGAFVIPVHLDGVVKEAKSNLHEYHKDDLGAGGRKKYCKLCNKEITDAEIVKGIEISKGQIVTFSKEEMDSLPLPTTKNVEVDRFCLASELNELTFDTNYYAVPQAGGEGAFNLFAQGLKRLGKVAVGKVAMASRENLCVLRPVGNGMVLSTMVWVNEVKPMPTVAETPLTDNAIDLIGQVIGKFTKPFSHTDYVDKYDVALAAMAADKVAGKVINIVASKEAPQQNIEDALAALLK